MLNPLCRRLPRLASLMAAAAVLASGAPAIAATPGAHTMAASRAAVSAGLRESSDRLITGLGDGSGYRLFEASAAGKWSWRQLAVLAPGGVTGERWTGSECLTGDGKTAVAVVAPWHAVNSEAGMERGGTAYAVDLATGKTKVLASGVALYYFNPGCGIGTDVALTRYLGSSQQATQVLQVNADTGQVAATHTIDAEITSAVPYGAGVVAARGGYLVRLVGNQARIAARLPGAGFDLTPGAGASIDLLTARHAGAGTMTTAWRWGAGILARVSAPDAGRVSLFAGRAGDAFLTVVPSAGMRGVSALPATDQAFAAVSLDGTVLAINAPLRKGETTPLLPALRDRSGRILRAATAPPAPTMRADTAAYPVSAAASVAGARVPARDAALQRSAAAQAAAPACSIPRADLNIQVPQPSNDQINWAVSQAVINSLPSRPAEFDNMPTTSYSPEKDLPQPALIGAPGQHVPAILVDAILAQESNWNQASWHASPGITGDPLVADYYGDGGSNASPFNYAASDCGYGLGQITDGMRTGTGNLNPAIQQRVAVDYAENVAAAVSILAGTWNQLVNDNVLLNDGDPRWLEDWYTTAWAYNSGIQPTSASYGLPTTGTDGKPCTQGSQSCTDSAGNWGLGWSNNPINPIYPPNREYFLLTTYADASTPQDWPYQERVFGWMNTALQRAQVSSAGSPPSNTHAYTPLLAAAAIAPQNAFCSNAPGHNNCNPADPARQYCGYQQANNLQYHCWWHQSLNLFGYDPATGNCTSFASGCTPQPADASPGQPEPASTDYNPYPPTCGVDGNTVLTPKSTTQPIIVTDEASPQWDPENNDVNLAGCPANPRLNLDSWSQGGTFSVSNVWDSNGNPLPGQVGFHQLGAGFGGHMWFDNMVGGSDPADTVTATWTPTLNPTTGSGVYRIYVFVPDIGATANAQYKINENYARPDGVSSTFTASVNQSNASGWVDIGAYYLKPGATVSVTNNTDSSGADLGINAVAFVPFTSDAAGKSWVAMGDSYSSGEGAPPYDPATDTLNVNMCHRSGMSYSEQILSQTSYFTGGGFAVAACSGAQSSQLLDGQGTDGPQLAVLSNTTSLITLSIGINDLQFADILATCVTMTDTAKGDCQGSSDPNIKNLDAHIAAEGATLQQDYTEIHEQAPNAKIVVLTYPDIFQHSPGCLGITDNDMNWLSTEAGKFDAAISNAVNASAAAMPIYLVNEQQAFAGHNYCSVSGPQWVNQVNLLQIGNLHVKQQFFHPTTAGYAQVAADLLTLLQTKGLG